MLVFYFLGAAWTAGSGARARMCIVRGVGRTADASCHRSPLGAPVPPPALRMTTRPPLLAHTLTHPRPPLPPACAAISSGVFVPMLLIGACIGRMVGLVTVDIAAAHGAGSEG